MSHVVQLVHALEVGGAEVLASDIARELKRHGYRSSVWGVAGSGVLEKGLLQDGIGTAIFDAPDRIRLGVMGRLIARIEREKVDIIVTHHFRQLVHALPAAVLLRKRLVHVEHDDHFYRSSPRHLRWLSFLLRGTSGFVAVSSDVADYFNVTLGKRAGCRSIPNGIDTSRFVRDFVVRKRQRQSYGVCDDDLLIGTCCRLEPVKNIELLISGFSIFSQQHSNSRLMIVGEGTTRSDLEAQVRRLGLTSRVVFAGMQSRIHEYLSAFDIFALTSRNEGLPLAVLEAMSSKLPVVSTDVGSLAAVVKPNSGVLLPEPTPEAVSEAFEVLADSTLRGRMGEAARCRIETDYSQQQMMQSYLEVLTAKGSRR